MITCRIGGCTPTIFVMAGLFAISNLLLHPASAHEVRPSYFELNENRVGEFEVLLKTPMRGDLRLALTPVLSAKTEVLAPTSIRITRDAAVRTWRLKALEPLRGQNVRLDGLENTTTDALVRIAFLDGTSWVHRLTP